MLLAVAGLAESRPQDLHDGLPSRSQQAATPGDDSADTPSHLLLYLISLLASVVVRGSLSSSRDVSNKRSSVVV